MEFFDESSSDTYDSIAVIRHIKCPNCDIITDYIYNNGRCDDCGGEDNDD